MTCLGNRLYSASMDLSPEDEALVARIQAGELIEDMADFTPRYRAVLQKTLDIAAQGEVTVLTWAAYWVERSLPMAADSTWFGSLSPLA